MLSAAALDQARQIAEAHMPDTLERQLSGAWTPDAEGGGSYGPGSTETMPCRLGTPSREMERLIAEQTIDPTSLPLSFPVGRTLSPQNRVRITSARFGTAVTYELTSVEGLHSYSVEGKATVRKVGP